jgi:hypothetical protein
VVTSGRLETGLHAVMAGKVFESIPASAVTGRAALKGCSAF